jgi:hypothetical protein
MAKKVRSSKDIAGDAAAAGKPTKIVFECGGLIQLLDVEHFVAVLPAPCETAEWFWRSYVVSVKLTRIPLTVFGQRFGRQSGQNVLRFGKNPVPFVFGFQFD